MPRHLRAAVARVAAEENDRVVRASAYRRASRGPSGCGVSCGTGEHAVERVVVGRRNRIELVIVAAGAGDGQPHQAAGHDVDAIVVDVERVVEEPAAEREEAHRRRVGGISGLIGGELRDDELVERHVAVEARR